MARTARFVKEQGVDICWPTGANVTFAEVVLISTGVFSPMRNGTHIFEHDFLRLPMKSKQENLLKLFIKKNYWIISKGCKYRYNRMTNISLRVSCKDLIINHHL
jgi:hypothetical protein